MIVVPAIDVRGGRVVRLVRGRPEDETVYAEDPVEVARRWVGEGAPLLHVVDLDAALGTGDGRDAVRRIVGAVDVPVQVGGGLRSVGAISDAVADGAHRVVLGTEAAADPAFVMEAVSRFADRVVVALDTDGQEVRVRGWTEAAGPLRELLARLEGAGAPRFLVTAIGRDGTLEGPDLGLYERLLSWTDRPVLASGGVRDAADLRALANTGVEGAVVGKALYEGTLRLAEALEVGR